MTTTEAAIEEVAERRAFRTPPCAPRPRPVTLPNGSRGSRAPVTYLPGPPPDRPRFAHQRLSDEQHGAMGVAYRTYLGGPYVVAYGRAQADGSPPLPELPGVALARVEPYRDWVAVLWTAHPLLLPRRARLLRVLGQNLTYQELLAVIDAWELSGEVEA